MHQRSSIDYRIVRIERKQEEVMAENMTTALRVKEIRNKTGLSQKRFAEEYEIPKRTLESWESGERIPPAYVISLLERVVASTL